MGLVRQCPAARAARHSGDTIVLETMMHSHNQIVPGTTIEQIKKTRQPGLSGARTAYVNRTDLHRGGAAGTTC
jgi:hypothetical protein